MTGRSTKAIEAIALADWCRAVLKFLSKLETDPVVAQFSELVDRAADRKSVRGLKSLKGELHNWAKTLPPDQLQQLNEDLRKEHLEDLNPKIAADNRAVSRILASNQIQNEGEYHLLRDWVDEHLTNPSLSGEVDKADALLTRFGTKVQ
jgi:hypothetical protein